MEIGPPTMTCVLKIYPDKPGWQRHMMRLLLNIKGIYKCDIDAEENTAVIAGTVDPAIILRILAKSRTLVEIERVRFGTQPKMKFVPYNNMMMMNGRYHPKYGGGPFASLGYLQNPSQPQPQPQPQPPVVDDTPTCGCCIM